MKPTKLATQGGSLSLLHNLFDVSCLIACERHNASCTIMNAYNTRTCISTVTVQVVMLIHHTNNDDINKYIFS